MPTPHKTDHFFESYFRGTTAVILMFDVTNQTSFDSVQTHLLILQSTKAYTSGTINPHILVLGLKADHDDTNRVVLQHVAHQWCENNGYHYFETSSKDNINIDDPITYLVPQMIAQSKGATNVERLDQHVDVDVEHKSDSSGYFSGCQLM